MRQVKIISGTYGHKPEGAATVSPVKTGEMVELSDGEANRLVRLRVAEYAEISKCAVPGELVTNLLPGGIAIPDNAEIGMGTGANPSENETGAGGEGSAEILADDDGDDEGRDGDTENDAADIPEYSTETSLGELKDIFKDCGLAYKVGMSKIEMVAHLDEYFAAYDAGEALPTLGAEGPVT